MNAKSNGKHPGGRPSKKDQVNVEQLKKLVSEGWNEKEIAAFFNVSLAALKLYKVGDKEFLAAVKEGRELADRKVERSLYEAACGYSHVEDKIFCQNGITTTVPTIKRYAPDTVAAMFWLCNRQRDNWQHINKILHAGTDGKELTINVVSLAENAPKTWVKK